MSQDILFSRKGKSVVNTSGPVSSLGLEGLVIPMNPDLGVMIYDPFVGRMIAEAQALGEDILHLPDTYARLFKEKYGIIKREGWPFQVPSRSAHVIDGHKKRLAENLIYACPIDVKDGMPHFDLDLLRETVENAMIAAEEKAIRILGLPSLMSAQFSNKYSMKQVLQTTAEAAMIRLANGTGLQTVYVLSLPQGFKTIVLPTTQNPSKN